MFFKTSKETQEKIKTKEETDGEEGEGTQEQEPCERCGSMEHISCMRLV